MIRNPGGGGYVANIRQAVDVPVDPLTGFPLPPVDIEGTGAVSTCLMCAAAEPDERCGGCPRGRRPRLRHLVLDPQRKKEK